MTQSVNLGAVQQQPYDLIQKAKTGDDTAINELCSS